jgi:hypothetical protein
MPPGLRLGDVKQPVDLGADTFSDNLKKLLEGKPGVGRALHTPQMFTDIKNTFFPGNTLSDPTQFASFRESLEAVVNDCTIEWLTSLPNLLLAEMDLDLFATRVRASLAVLFKKIEQLVCIFPFDDTHEIAPRSSLFNLTLILLLSNMVNDESESSLASRLLSFLESSKQRLSPAASGPEVIDGPQAASAAGSQKGWWLSDMIASVTGLLHSRSSNDVEPASAEAAELKTADQLERLFSEPVGQIFLEALFAAFERRFKSDQREVPADFNGLYCAISVLSIATDQQPLLIALLKRGRFTDCPDINGLTLLISLLDAYPAGGDEHALMDLIKQLHANLVLCGLPSRDIQAYFVSTWQCEVDEPEGDQRKPQLSAFTIASNKGFMDVAELLKSYSAQLVFRELLETCNEGRRELTFDGVAVLLNRGLDPECEVVLADERSLSLLSLVKEVDDSLAPDIKKRDALIVLMSELYKAFNLEAYHEHRGFAAKIQSLNDALTKADEVYNGLILGEFFNRLLDEENPLLTDFFSTKRVKPNVEQQKFIALLFGAQVFLEKLQARVNGVQVFPSLATAAQLFAEHFSTKASPDDYAQGCYKQGLKQLQALSAVTGQSARTADGEADVLPLNPRDEMWLARLKSLYSQRLLDEHEGGLQGALPRQGGKQKSNPSLRRKKQGKVSTTTAHRLSRKASSVPKTVKGMLYDDLIGILSPFGALPKDPKKAIHGVRLRYQSGSDEYRAGLEGFVHTLSLMYIRKLIKLFGDEKVDVVKDKVEAELDAYLQRLDLLGPIFPEDEKNGATPRASVFNYALIAFFKACFETGVQNDRPAQLSKALARAFSEVVSGGDSIKKKRLGRRRHRKPLPAVRCDIENSPVETYFIQTVLQAFINRVDAQEKQADFNGIYQSSSVFHVAGHKPLLAQVLPLFNRFLDCPKADGSTHLIELLLAYKPDGKDEIDCLVAVSKLIEAFSEAGWKHPFRNAYLSSSYKNQTASVIATSNGLKDVAVYLYSVAPALALEHLFEEAAREERLLNFSEVVQLLNADLDVYQPVSCGDQKTISLYGYFQKQQEIADTAEGPDVDGPLEEAPPVGIAEFQLVLFVILLNSACEKQDAAERVAAFTLGLERITHLDQNIAATFSSLIATGFLLPRLVGFGEVEKTDAQQRYIQMLSHAMENFAASLSEAERRIAPVVEGGSWTDSDSDSGAIQPESPKKKARWMPKWWRKQQRSMKSEIFANSPLSPDGALLASKSGGVPPSRRGLKKLNKVVKGLGHPVDESDSDDELFDKPVDLGDAWSCESGGSMPITRSPARPHSSLTLLADPLANTLAHDLKPHLADSHAKKKKKRWRKGDKGLAANSIKQVAGKRGRFKKKPANKPTKEKVVEFEAPIDGSLPSSTAGLHGQPAGAGATDAALALSQQPFG